MAKSLAKRKQTLPDKPFVWKGKDQRTYAPDDMATGHLFNTISMIWNHSMPEQVRTHNYIRYQFGSFYTLDYMMQAVRVMLPILLRRPDLSPFQRSRLLYMHNCLIKNPQLGQKDDPQNEPNLQLAQHDC